LALIVENAARMVGAVGDFPVRDAGLAAARFLPRQQRDHVAKIERAFAAQMLRFGEAAQVVAKADAPRMGVEDARPEGGDEIREDVVAPDAGRARTEDHPGGRRRYRGEELAESVDRAGDAQQAAQGLRRVVGMNGENRALPPEGPG